MIRRLEDRTGYLMVTDEGKRKLTGVTGALSTVLGKPYLGPEEAGIRGRYVHDATALMDGGRDGSGLDWKTVPAGYVGYLDAWGKFKDDARFTPVLIEEAVWSELPPYAGTLDRFGVFDHGGSKEGYVLLDIKSGEDELAEYQTAAYLCALLQHPPEAIADRAREVKRARRCSVKLRQNGTYKVRWHEQASDLQVFFACLTLYPLLKGKRP